MTNATLWEKVLAPWPLVLFIIVRGALPQHAVSERTTQSASKAPRAQLLSNDADNHWFAACFGRRRPAAPQRHQASSTCTARSDPAVSSRGRRGQLRIRKRITTASSSRNFVDGRARPAPVATPDRRRGLSQTNAGRARPDAARSRSSLPTRAGRRARLGAARGRGPRHRDGAAAARPQGRRGGGRGDLQPGRERPVARPAQEPAALGS